jgi:hypothetical protein
MCWGQGRADSVHLTGATRRSRARQDRDARNENGRVLDERGIGMPPVLGKMSQRQPTFLERRAVGRVLRERAIEVGCAEALRGEPVAEIRRRRADDRVPDRCRPTAPGRRGGSR